jgi:hypothetical protein
MAMAHPSGLRASEPIWSPIGKSRFRRRTLPAPGRS